MGLLNTLFGFRWSLYVVQNERTCVYIMHGDAVFGLVNYVARYFANGAKPVPPWGLYLNFNKTHKFIKLTPEHFTPGGTGVDAPSKLLRQQIYELDVGCNVPWSEPIFVEAATKKRIRINALPNSEYNGANWEKLVAGLQEVTFFGVMETVFGKK